MYWDESLSANFDDLLDSGYSMVLNKKHERDLLKEQVEQNRLNIEEMEKLVIPEINRLFNLKNE